MATAQELLDKLRPLMSHKAQVRIDARQLIHRAAESGAHPREIREAIMEALLAEELVATTDCVTVL